MHIRETPEFLSKIDFLKGVFGEKSRTKTLNRAIDLADNLSRDQDFFDHKDVKAIIKYRLNENEEDAEKLSYFLRNLFLCCSRRQGDGESELKNKIMEAMIMTDMTLTDYKKIEYTIHFVKSDDGIKTSEHVSYSR